MSAANGALAVVGPIGWAAVVDPYAAVAPNWNATVPAPRSGFRATPWSAAAVVDTPVAAAVVAPGDPTSNAPRSQAVPAGRSTPRASVAGHPALSPLSRAALPGSRPIVSTGPPLPWSVPISGSVSTRSPGP